MVLVMIIYQLLPGYDDAHENVADETHDAQGDVGDGEGPQHVVLHPAQYTLQYSTVQYSTARALDGNKGQIGQF